MRQGFRRKRYRLTLAQQCDRPAGRLPYPRGGPRCRPVLSTSRSCGARVSNQPSDHDSAGRGAGPKLAAFAAHETHAAWVSLTRLLLRDYEAL